MSSWFFDTSDGVGVNGDVMSCSPAQRSPNCDLQYFYENFNPESNEEYLSESPCKDRGQDCNVGDDITYEYSSQVKYHQATYSIATPHVDTYSKCNHHNQIKNFCTKTSPGTNSNSRTGNQAKQIKKTISKKKRKRTTFTTEQIIAMEQIFKSRPYIVREERLKLTERLNVSEKSIKVWFQNRRRISEKRENLYVPDSPSSVDSCESNSERLAYIEAQINDTVDEHGNVSLSEQLLTELVGIIDACLSKDIQSIEPQPEEIYGHNEYNKSNVLFTDVPQASVIMYEPISPASVIDDFLS